MIPKPIILDISEWQVPEQINYSLLGKSIAGVIVRIQYGSLYVDRHFETHIRNFQKLGVPVAVYAWVRGSSYQDMEKEAQDFYHRAQKFQPEFWWLDVEEQTMTDMRGGCEAYRQELKKLGATKVGAYVANHLYHRFNLATEKFDGIWLPTYGANNGTWQGQEPTASQHFALHQYTSAGRLPGFTGQLDLNRLSGQKSFAELFGEKSQTGGLAKMKQITLTSPVYLREKADSKGKSIALLKAGEQVNFDDIIQAQGYLWAVQPRKNGQKGYLALGEFKSYGTIS